MPSVPTADCTKAVVAILTELSPDAGVVATAPEEPVKDDPAPTN